MSLKIVIVGPGRIGMTLARSTRSSGHDVELLGRLGSYSVEVARAERFSVFTDAKQKCWDEIDLILLAFSIEKPEGGPLALHSSFFQLAHNSAGIPLASVVGSIDLYTLAAVFGNRPIARFFCSAAVGKSAAVRFYDENSSPEAMRLLNQALPSYSWRSVPSASFDRYSTLFVASALVCVPLIELAEMLGPLTVEENDFLIGTLDEAKRLIDEHVGDPTAAYASALTPGGMTESFSQRVFKRKSIVSIGKTGTTRKSA